MSVIDQIFEKAKQNPQKVAFPEALNEKMMEAAYQAGENGYIYPVLIGNPEEIGKTIMVAKEYNDSLTGYHTTIDNIINTIKGNYEKC